MASMGQALRRWQREQNLVTSAGVVFDLAADLAVQSFLGAVPAGSNYSWGTFLFASEVRVGLLDWPDETA